LIQVVSTSVLIGWAIITMSSHRIQRVSELVKREVSRIVLELNLTDCGLVTITAAEVSPDLKEGRIFVSVIGSAEQKQQALDTLERQHGHIQRELGHHIVLKYTPKLKFFLDETEDRASHIEHLLDELENEPPHD
jgi:ribosome-binding factor A